MSERSRRQSNSSDAEQQEGAGVNNAIKPNYYQMPNGVEVSAITDYLTFNGGNAVKYVARSSRVDGVIKSDKIEDLCKAGPLPASLRSPLPIWMEMTRSGSPWIHCLAS